jgi:pimeloyl-ACP methyl ester carboxylesterase
MASRKIVDDFMINGMLMGSKCFKPRRLVIPTVLKDNDLQRLRVPALFLVGANEKIYSARKSIKRLNKAAPHIKTDIVPNAGHDLTFVQAEIVNKKILEFMKRPGAV